MDMRDSNIGLSCITMYFAVNIVCVVCLLLTYLVWYPSCHWPWRLCHPGPSRPVSSIWHGRPRQYSYSISKRRWKGLVSVVVVGPEAICLLRRHTLVCRFPALRRSTRLCAQASSIFPVCRWPGHAGWESRSDPTPVCRRHPDLWLVFTIACRWPLTDSIWMCQWRCGLDAV